MNGTQNFEEANDFNYKNTRSAGDILVDTMPSTSQSKQKIDSIGNIDSSIKKILSSSTIDEIAVNKKTIFLKKLELIKKQQKIQMNRLWNLKIMCKKLKTLNSREKIKLLDPSFSDLKVREISNASNNIPSKIIDKEIDRMLKVIS